jgi:hypothetical protein
MATALTESSLTASEREDFGRAADVEAMGSVLFRQDTGDGCNRMTLTLRYLT